MYIMFQLVLGNDQLLLGSADQFVDKLSLKDPLIIVEQHDVKRRMPSTMARNVK